MGTYTGELKCNLKTIRLTDTALKQVLSFPGNGFNEKLDNMIAFTMSPEQGELKDKMLDIQKEIGKLEAQRDTLLNDIGKLQESKILVDSVLNKLGQLNRRNHFQNENQIEKQKDMIKNMISKAGYQVRGETIENIAELNQLTGKQHSLKEISLIFKNKEFAPETQVQQLADKIGKDFKSQECDKALEVGE